LEILQKSEKLNAAFLKRSKGGGDREVSTKDSYSTNRRHCGSVEKSRQRRSRHFSVLTYWKYAPRAKLAAALLDELF